MDSRDQIIATLRGALPGLSARYSVASLSLFGSVARGDQSAQSDIDLAVTFHDVPSFWGYVDLQDELTALLGRPVDLVCRDGLKPLIRERVAREEVSV